MNILKALVVMLAFIVAVAGMSLYLLSHGDDDAPTITCSESEMIVTTVDCTDGQLLSYVTAEDKQDGDLSNSVVVTRKTFFIADKTSVVTFSVCDSDNNVTSIDRKVYFEDYKPPRLVLTNDFIFPSGNYYNLGNYVTAEDMFDGDIDNKVKIIAAEYSVANGTYRVNIKVTNSMADSTEITFDSIVTNDDYGLYRVRLNEYSVYTTVGAPEMDYRANLKSVINKNKTSYTIDDVVVDSSEVDMSTPGCYSVYYRILSDDEEPKTISMSRLLVIVEEANQ